MPETLSRNDLDTLYHLLRKTSLSRGQVRRAVSGLAEHLTTPGGYYPGLNRWLEWYGTEYLLPRVIEAMPLPTSPYRNVVELGCGTGWLGRGIADHFHVSYIGVDKRSPAILLVDLETEEGRAVVLNNLKSGDLLVLSEFIHCLKNPEEVLESFHSWPWVVLEYDAFHSQYGDSYRRQLGLFGVSSITRNLVLSLVKGRRFSWHNLDPYRLYLVAAEEGK